MAVSAGCLVLAAIPLLVWVLRHAEEKKHNEETS
jgi:hypothetical protein